MIFTIHYLLLDHLKRFSNYHFIIIQVNEQHYRRDRIVPLRISKILNMKPINHYFKVEMLTYLIVALENESLKLWVFQKQLLYFNFQKS